MSWEAPSAQVGWEPGFVGVTWGYGAGRCWGGPGAWVPWSLPGARCPGTHLELQKLPLAGDSSRHQGEMGALGNRSLLGAW